jgi:general stress protein 26
MSIETVEPDSMIQKLGRLISGIKVAMLTTEDQDGCLHSRPMATLNRNPRGDLAKSENQDRSLEDKNSLNMGLTGNEFDGTLWFFCREDAGKTEEIRNHKRVNLAYSSSENKRYVSIAGTAEIVRDHAKILDLWDPSYEAWFPRGVEDAVLIRVNVESAQYWELPHGPVTHLKGLLKAVKSGRSYNPKENGETEKFKIA